MATYPIVTRASYLAPHYPASIERECRTSAQSLLYWMKTTIVQMTNFTMQADIKVIDPLGDLIIELHNPNHRELVADIILVPRSGKQEEIKAEERGGSELHREKKPDTLHTEGTIASSGELALEAEMQPFQSRLEELSRHVEQLKIATGELAEVMNAARSNEQNTVSTLQPTAIGEDNVVRFRISSSHLRLASAQFRRLLSSTYPNTLEGQLSLEDGTKCNVLGTEQWDSKVFLMLLQIVHGYNRQVPDSIDLDTLGKLAILVDYYECHERVELFARRWIEALRGQVPKAYGDAAILWLAISWVFIDKPIFKQMTQIILRHSTCPFQADTLPLPPILIGMYAPAIAHNLTCD